MTTAPRQEPVSFQGRDVRITGDRWEPPPGRKNLGVVLLLHGGGQTRHSWRQSARRLAEHDWTAVTLDARGHGDSGWAPDGDYSIDAMVDDLRRVADRLDESPVLIGASMGGMTALIAEGERHFARAVVLVDVAPRIEPTGVERITSFMGGARDGFGSLEEAAEAVRAYNPHRKQRGSLDGLRRNLRQGEDGRWRWHWDPAFMRLPDEASRDLDGRRSRAAAGRIGVPLLLVRGMQSDVVSPEGVAELLALVPGARHTEVADAGHMVAGDDNDVFSRGVLDFLDDTLGGRR
ncbi:MAG: alpha/beta hydrolase fold protein [Streptosporangiaceae bacterium]|jgi:pimeloyl-ACP methyl ester carboxylesterase|nr:alpha/beta hydrolase fold protein [Streptosporangiaceae bacterium]